MKIDSVVRIDESQIRSSKELNLHAAGEACATFAQYEDKNSSFTDCSSRVVMDQMKLAQGFAFDQHFRHFGTVNVVPYK